LGEGRITKLGKTIAFLEGRLIDADGGLVATATASARVVPTAGLARIESGPAMGG
jgi:acyl-coenzyme A thioesterase PaaI-like protein